MNKNTNRYCLQNIGYQMKNNWIKFLAAISFIATLLSCETTVDREFNVEYVFRNDSKYDISFRIMGTILDTKKSELLEDSEVIITLEPQQEHIIEAIFPTNDKDINRPEGMLNQNAILGDSVKVFFNSERYLLFIKEIEKANAIYQEEGYEYEKQEDLSFKYTYQFSDDDFNDAIPTN